MINARTGGATQKKIYGVRIQPTQMILVSAKKLTFHFGNRRATSLFMLWMPRSIKPNSAPAEILDATNMKVRPAMESKPIELTETREFLLEAALIKARESIESGSKGLRNVTCNTGTEAYQQAEQGIKDALTSINSVLGE